MLLDGVTQKIRAGRNTEAPIPTQYHHEYMNSFPSSALKLGTPMEHTVSQQRNLTLT